MGAADVVPGVSGGTIAFITGIYETLINSLKSINPTLLKVLKEEGIAKAWQQINGTFLVVLFTGIAVSIMSLAKLLSYLLVEYPELLWAFFFGLIVASAIFVGRQIERWKPRAIMALVAGIIIAYLITIAAPAEAPTDLWMVFLAGCVAICAMILPGISGSFILLLMGMYGHILGAVKDLQIGVMSVFAAGCLTGLLTFSHVLSWMFSHYRNTTLALLTGFMIGSLNKVWPWQQVMQTRVNSHGEEVPFLLKNVSPTNYLELTSQEPMLLPALGLMVAGFSIVFLLEKMAGGE